MKILRKISSYIKTTILPSKNNKITKPISSANKLSNDVVLINPETKLMNEVRTYGKEHGVETARIIDENGNIINLAMKESTRGVYLANESFLSLFLKVENTTLIHNHNVELPLSFTDINSLLCFQLSKITATTPSGKFSSMIFPADKMMRMEDGELINPKGMNNIYDDIEKLSIEEIELLKVLKIFHEDEKIMVSKLNNAPNEVIQQLAQWRNIKIQELADKYGLEYKHNFNMLPSHSF